MTYLEISAKSASSWSYSDLKHNASQDLRRKLRFAAKQGWMRASVLAAVLDALELPLVGVVTLLRQYRLLHSQIRRPDGLVPLTNFILFMEALAAHVSEPTLGARIGSIIRPIDLGPIGLLMSVTPTLRAGLHLLSCYRDTLQSSTDACLADNGEYSAFVYQLEADSVLPDVQWCELFLAAICSLLRARLGQSWSPLEIHFKHRPGLRGPALEHIFRAPLSFNKTVTKIIIPSIDLDRKLRSANKEVLTALECHANELIEMHYTSFKVVSSGSS